MLCLSLSMFLFPLFPCALDASVLLAWHEQVPGSFYLTENAVYACKKRRSGPPAYFNGQQGTQASLLSKWYRPVQGL